MIKSKSQGRNNGLGKLFFTLLTTISIMSCQQNESRIAVNHVNDDHTVVRVEEQKKYLLLPIQESAREAEFKVNVPGQEELILFIRLAVDTVDYYVPFDLSAYNTKELEFNILWAPPTALCWKEMSLSDDFDASNREGFRPQYHFTPQYGWMNDPNGMVYLDGEYHLYYQHNPYGSMWGNMHWGHAVSKDLIHWEHLPVALAPDSLGTIFSGSAVIDKENVAGFGKDALIAFYTSAGKRQTQSIAYSLDKGRTFTKYEGNPVVTADIPDFRDPKVFYHAPTSKWIMIVAAGQEVQLYSSANLKEWQYESSFGHGYGNHDGVWECPDLLELPVDGNADTKKWVLLLNINPGGPFGGSATQYFIGDFDGTTFTCADKPEVTKWMDWGKDHYATVSWSNAPDNRAVVIAWMSNWQYANNVPTQQYRGGGSVPRDISLFTSGKDILLASSPSEELLALRTETKDLTPFTVTKESNFDSLLDDNMGTYEIEMDIIPRQAEVMGFKLFNEKGENVDICINMTEKTISMDRRQSGVIGFSSDFPAVTLAPIEKGESYRLRVFVDKSSIELFLNNGRTVMTNLVYPTAPYNRMNFYSKGGNCKVDRMRVHRF